MDISTVNIIGYFTILVLLGYYIITTLQWYSYKLKRVFFHHTKSYWNIIYFIIPILAYDFMAFFYQKFSFVVAVIYNILFWFWIKGVDKRVVFTGRVKRFFVVLLSSSLLTLFISDFKLYLVSIPLFLSILISNGIEKILFKIFVKKAKEIIDSMDRLKIIGVTASYGKTSIKNYISTILSTKYNVYSTPRSVNTFVGILKDINENLTEDKDIYVVEMGARKRGDIKEISTFVNPHYAIVGKIGSAHIEYFKSIENIKETKMEILLSNRLKKAWIHKSVNLKSKRNIEIFGDEVEEIEATLQKTCFKMEEVKYCAKVLGEFNAENLAVAIKVATELGLTPDEIKRGLNRVSPVPHRLQKINAGGKIILDDGFNGNIDGVLASFKLVSQHQGRKVLVTPGLVEVNRELNEEVAKRANEIFDLIIVTGELNKPIFEKFIDEDKLILLPDKSQLQETLQTQTYERDLILFSNDAPSFV